MWIDVYKRQGLHGVAGRGSQLLAIRHPPVKVRYQLLIHIGIADAGIQIRRQLIVQRIAAGRQRGIHCGGHLGHQAVIHHLSLIHISKGS